MTLPWLPLGTFSYAFVAKMGFWEKRGLDVAIDRGFGSGKVCCLWTRANDFRILDLAVMMNCAGRGLDLVAVAGIWPRSPVGIFSLKEYGINKPKDLEGQTVAFDVGSGDFQLWPAFVKATGIDDSKVNKVTMDAAALIKVLVEKQVKAEGNFFGSIAPSLWAQGLEITQHPLRGLRDQDAQQRRPMQARHDRKRPELCQGFVEGLMDGLKYVYLNPEKSVQLLECEGFQGSNSQPEGDRAQPGREHCIGTVPAFRKTFWATWAALVEQTARTVETYMGVKNLPKTDTMFTNKFVGFGQTSATEWKAVDQAAKYLPRRLAAVRGPGSCFHCSRPGLRETTEPGRATSAPASLTADDHRRRLTTVGTHELGDAAIARVRSPARATPR
jgi:NitT/TauT family transport system substrate-binding protein